MTRLGQLTSLKVAQTNQRRLVDDPDVLASIDVILAVVARQSRQIEADLVDLIQADPLWRRLDNAFREIESVANRAVAQLMAEMPRSEPSPAKPSPSSPASPPSLATAA